jgi:hypothetical protein
VASHASNRLAEGWIMIPELVGMVSLLSAAIEIVSGAVSAEISGM